MKGLYVITQNDILKSPKKDDAIAISSFPIDSHDCQRIAVEGGGVINEGTIFPVRNQKLKQGYAYHVPYRSILPKPEQCDNLLVPVALSCTHVGISSLRIEGAWMVIGQAAGIAAALAADQDVAVQDLKYERLRRALLRQEQVLELPDLPGPTPTGDSIPATSLQGIVLDDNVAKLTGDWSRSTNFKPYIEDGYIFNGEKGSKAKGDGEATATFRFKVQKSGDYALSMAYSAHPTRAGNVPVTVSGGGITKKFIIDQTKAPQDGQPFRRLGVVQLQGQGETTITVNNRGTTGFVIVDAFRLLPLK